MSAWANGRPAVPKTVYAGSIPAVDTCHGEAPGRVLLPRAILAPVAQLVVAPDS